MSAGWRVAALAAGWRVAALAAGVALAGALPWAAAPALAASAPPDIHLRDTAGPLNPGATVTAFADKLTITADVPAFWAGVLTLSWPQAAGQKQPASCVLGAADQQTSPVAAGLGPFTLDTRSFTEAKPTGTATPHCSTAAGPPAVNGGWQVQLNLSNAAGQTQQETFPVTLATPPAPVTGVAATSSGMTVTVSWQPGTEPDLTGYDLLTRSDTPVAAGISPASACGSSGCAVSFQASAPGSYSFVVRSERSTAPGSADTIASADSAPASVTVSAPASPGPTSSASGTTSPPPAASRSGATPGAGTAAAIFGHFVPGLSAAAAPPVPSGGDVPVVAAPPDNGGFALTLPYGSTPAVAVARPADPRRRAAARPATATVRDAAALLAKPAAGSLLLLLFAAHVAALLWLTRPRPQRRRWRRPARTAT